MKTKVTLIIGTSVIAMFSCDTKNYTEEDRVRVTTELESYVDSVESAIQTIPVHNWEKIDERFDSLDSRAEKVYNDLKTEDNNLEMIEERYETVVNNAKTEFENFERTAEMHMKNVESWWDKAAAKVEKRANNTGEDIEQATQESLEWLETNFDKLSDESKQKYEKVRTALKKN